MFQLLSFDCMLIRRHTGRCWLLRYHHSFTQINNNRCLFPLMSFYIYIVSWSTCGTRPNTVAVHDGRWRRRLVRRAELEWTVGDQRRRCWQYASPPPDAAKSSTPGPFCSRCLWRSCWHYGNNPAQVVTETRIPPDVLLNYGCLLSDGAIITGPTGFHY